MYVIWPDFAPMYFGPTVRFFMNKANEFLVVFYLHVLDMIKFVVG